MVNRKKPESSHDGDEDDADQDLGRRVAAAVISYQMGLSVAYVYKGMQGKPIGAFWVTEGQRLLRQSLTNVADALGGPEPEEDKES